MHPNEADVVNLAEYSAWEQEARALDEAWRLANERTSGIPHRDALLLQRKRQLDELGITTLTLAQEVLREVS